ncbi:hypothetical protein HK096_005828, partial [Nowakowskiella sp. JEL0078]
IRFSPIGITLAIVFANRSAALFEMSEFDLCISDIERSLELGFHPAPWKLFRRKSRCLQKILESKRNGESNKGLCLQISKNSILDCLNDAYSLTRSDPLFSSQIKLELKLAEEFCSNNTELFADSSFDRRSKNDMTDSESCVSVASSIKVVDYPDLGEGQKGVNASKDISSGEQLLKETPFSYILSPLTKNRCEWCLNISLNPIPNEFNYTETLDITSSLLLALSVSATKIFEDKKYTKADWVKLKKIANDFQMILAVIRLNSFAIKCFKKSGNYISENITELNEIVIGTGLYLSGSKFNHRSEFFPLIIFYTLTHTFITNSCIPNARVSFGVFQNRQPHLILRASRTSHKGEQLCISYGPMVSRIPNTKNRCELIKLKYGFICHCASCIEFDIDDESNEKNVWEIPLPQNITVSDLRFFCVYCDGLLRWNEKECLNCRLNITSTEDERQSRAK